VKSKDQKRREAIERLERQPRFTRNVEDEYVQSTWARRLEEAQRLRRAFSLPASDR
jgi:heme oxygenase